MEPGNGRQVLSDTVPQASVPRGPLHKFVLPVSILLIFSLSQTNSQFYANKSIPYGTMYFNLIPHLHGIMGLVKKLEFYPCFILK